MSFFPKAKSTRRLFATVAVLVAACATYLFFFTENRSEVGNTLAGVETVWISAGVEMVRIPAGEFMMGSPDISIRNPDEAPVHKVIFKKAFWMGKYEVTQKLWKSVMGSNPSEFRGPDLPVDSVSWDDIQIFLKKLNRQTKMSFRLPSEAEWEYAARAGTTGRFSFAKPISTTLANYDGTLDNPAGEYREKTVPIGSFVPNPWGLYQVHGNVVEWVQDCRHDSYTQAPADGSPWLSGSCGKRMLRGGCWDFTARESRSAHRFWLSPDSGYNIIGFRFVHDIRKNAVKSNRYKNRLQSDGL